MEAFRLGGEFIESLRRESGSFRRDATDEMLEKNPAEYQSFRNDGPEYQVPGGESFVSFMIGVRGIGGCRERNPGKKLESSRMVVFWGNLPLCLNSLIRKGTSYSKLG